MNLCSLLRKPEDVSLVKLIGIGKDDTESLNYYVDANKGQFSVQIAVVLGHAGRALARAILQNDMTRLLKTPTTLSALLSKAPVPPRRSVVITEMDLDEMLENIDRNQMKQLERVFADNLKDAFFRGNRRGAREIERIQETTIKVTDNSAVAYAKLRSAALVGKGKNKDLSITESTRRMLRATIAKAVEQEKSAEELALLITQNFAFSPARAKRIAETELVTAYSFGNLEGWRDSGEVTGKQWLTAPNCCDHCGDVGGEIVDLDEEFSNGMQGPAAHPNCRCDLAPVMKVNRVSLAVLLKSRKPGSVETAWVKVFAYQPEV